MRSTFEFLIKKADSLPTYALNVGKPTKTYVVIAHIKIQNWGALKAFTCVKLIEFLELANWGYNEGLSKCNTTVCQMLHQ